MEEVSHDLHIHSQPRNGGNPVRPGARLNHTEHSSNKAHCKEIKCGTPLEKRITMETNTFEQKLTEILARTLSGEVTPVEYALSNEPSETKGKVNQLVTFKYEVDEPSEKNSTQLKK